MEAVGVVVAAGFLGGGLFLEAGLAAIVVPVCAATAVCGELPIPPAEALKRVFAMAEGLLMSVTQRLRPELSTENVHRSCWMRAVTAAIPGIANRCCHPFKAVSACVGE